MEKNKIITLSGLALTALLASTHVFAQVQTTPTNCKELVQNITDPKIAYEVEIECLFNNLEIAKSQLHTTLNNMRNTLNLRDEEFAKLYQDEIQALREEDLKR